MLRTIMKFVGGALVAFGISSVAQADFQVGDPAPDFRLQDQNGQWHQLGQYAGRWVVLYFYPKDDTPGCTTEACSFRDNIFAFEDVGAVILGVSLDDVESHEAFAAKHQLPFTLLADVNGQTATDYGVLRTLGKLRFAQRESYVIDPDGRIAKHYADVNPATHTAEVLTDLKALMQSSG